MPDESSRLSHSLAPPSSHLGRPGDPLSASPWKRGTRIGEYVLLDLVGKGGMSVVFLAEHAHTHGRYAIKTLSEAADAALVERLRREGEIMASIDSHPNVVRVHALGREHGRSYLVLDYAAGGDLQTRVRSKGPLPPREAAELIRDLAGGLALMHSKGILHRDLKPGNILFDEEGTPKIVDFGLARSNENQSLTRSGDVIGTPAFMAPEQAVGHRREVGPWSDVYGLGGILYYTLTGESPVRGKSIVEVVDRVVRGDIRPLRSLVPDVPDALEEICRRTLALDRTARPTAAELEAELDEFLREDARIPGLRSPTKILLAVAVSCVLATAILTAAVVVSRRGPEPAPAPPPPATASTPKDPADTKPKERPARLHQRWDRDEIRRYKLVARGSVSDILPIKFERSMDLSIRAAAVSPARTTLEVEIREFASLIKRDGGPLPNFEREQHVQMLAMDFDTRRGDEPANPLNAIKGGTFALDLVPATGEVVEVRGVESIRASVERGDERRRSWMIHRELSNSEAMRRMLECLLHFAPEDGSVSGRWRILRKASELTDRTTPFDLDAEFQMTQDTEALAQVKWSGSGGDRFSTRGLEGKATLAAGKLRSAEFHERYVGTSSKFDFKVSLTAEE